MWHHKNHNLYQRVTDMIHVAIPTEYDKYPSEWILKHANVLSEVIKLQNVHLFNTKIYKKRTVLKSMCVQWQYRKFFTNKGFQTPLHDDQVHRVPNTKNIITKTLMYYLSNNRNNLHLNNVSQYWNIWS